MAQPNSLSVSTLINARWIVTINPQQPIIENGCIAIDKGQIVAVAPQNQLKITAQTTIDLPNHALMPGLINAHGHTPMTLFRGLADDLPLMDWLNNHIWPAESRWVDDTFAYDGAELAIAEMILGGTTCFSDMYFFPEKVAKAAVASHMRCQLAFPILDFPTNWANTADEYIHKGLQLMDAYRNHELVDICFGPHAPYTVSDAPLKRILTLAEETNKPIQIHLHETAFEVEDALAKTGQRPIERLNQLGLLSPQTQAVHMTQLIDSDIDLLIKTGTHVIHCPESNLKLASGFCPVAKLLDAGVNVALGTDGAASNNDLDMFSELRSAALLAKGVSQNPAAVPAYQALEMATLNGAKAMGFEQDIGSLEAGKRADIIAVDLNAIQATPYYDIVSQLAYATAASQVTDVWIAGRRVLENRKLQSINLAATQLKANQWQQRIQARDKK